MSIGSLATFSSGQGISISRLHPNSHDFPVPVYGGNGIAGYTSTPCVSAPTVVVGRVGQRCGEVHFAEGPSWITDNALYPTRVHQEFDMCYFALALGNVGLNQSKNRNDLPLLTQSILHAISIPWPSEVADQRAIAAALSDVDALLGGLDGLIAKKRDLKQAAMQQLLTGQTRLPGFHGEWEVKRLGNSCRTTTGRKDVNEGNPNGQFPFFTCSRSHTFSDSYSFDTEAILIAGNGEVGNLHYFNGKFEAYQRTYVLYDFSVQVSYLWQQLSANLAESLGLGKIGSSIPYIKKATLTEFEFGSPKDGDEQSAIAAVLSDMDDELAALEARRNKTRDLKQAMMQELLTGKTRLVPNGGTHA